MPEKQPRIALLTPNNSVGTYYLTRRLRQTFARVCIVALHDKPGFWRNLRKTANALGFQLGRAFHRWAFRYAYPPLQSVLPIPKADLYARDIHDPNLEAFFKAYRPDILCILGAETPGDPILATAGCCLNLQGGFLPHYSGVQAITRAACEGNFSYLGFSIHSADTGRIFSQEPVHPYFFESFGTYTKRLHIAVADRLIQILHEADLSASQPLHRADARHDTGSKFINPSTSKLGLRSDLSTQAARDFVSPNARRYKSTLPRTNGLEKKCVARVVPPAARVLPDGWYILNYHEILKSSETLFQNADIPAIYTHFDRFLEHLAYFQQNFQIVSLAEGVHRFDRDEAKAGRYLTLTFDDGLKSVENALAPLIEAGIVPALFLNADPAIQKTPLPNHLSLFMAEYTASKGNLSDLSAPLRQSEPLTYEHAYNCLGDAFRTFVRGKYLDTKFLSDALNQGLIEIGSHTRNHLNLNAQDEDVQRDQICTAHRELEALFKRNLNYFSFPFGKAAQRDFVSEYLAAQTGPYYFACSGGINQNRAPGAILRIAVHNESVHGLHHLLCTQFVR